MSTKKETAKLKVKGKKDAKPVEFTMSEANKLLKLPNCQWELADEKLEWNGIEIAKKG
jgi:hypothetical protein